MAPLTTFVDVSNVDCNVCNDSFESYRKYATHHAVSHGMLRQAFGKAPESYFSPLESEHRSFPGSTALASTAFTSVISATPQTAMASAQALLLPPNPELGSYTLGNVQPDPNSARSQMMARGVLYATVRDNQRGWVELDHPYWHNGYQDVECPHCAAYLYRGEKQGGCCANGGLAHYPSYTTPSFILDMLTREDHPWRKHVGRTARELNSAGALGCFTANRPQYCAGGPSPFSVHGKAYRKIGDAIAGKDKTPMLNTLLSYDGRTAHQLRLAQHPTLNSTVLSTVTAFLDMHNRLYADYRRQFAESGAATQFTFSIENDDTKQYSSQRANTLGIIQGLPNPTRSTRNVVLCAKGTGRFNDLAADNPNYEAVVYPLFNMLGEPSYTLGGRISKGKTFKNTTEDWRCDKCAATFPMDNTADWHEHWQTCNPTTSRIVPRNHRSAKPSNALAKKIHAERYLEFTRAKNILHIDISELTTPDLEKNAGPGGFFNAEIAEAHVSCHSVIRSVHGLVLGIVL